MLVTVEGVYRNGSVVLTAVPQDVVDETRVIVTFLPSGYVDLRERGISETQAAELRASLATFAADWESPDMDIYDSYEQINGDY